MLDLTQPVPFWFVALSIGAIFVVVGVGIMFVRNAKKQKDSTK